jgi:DNA-binding GntR family transcriptional regulator
MKKTYNDIAETMIMDILLGKYKPNELLPPKSILAKEYHTSTEMIIRAENLLLDRKYISLTPKQGRYKVRGDAAEGTK